MVLAIHRVPAARATMAIAPLRGPERFGRYTRRIVASSANVRQTALLRLHGAGVEIPAAAELDLGLARRGIEAPAEIIDERAHRQRRRTTGSAVFVERGARRQIAAAA